MPSCKAEASDLIGVLVPQVRRHGLAGAFALLQGAGAAGEIIGGGRIGSPLAEPREIPAGAWDHLELDNSSLVAWTLRTPEGVTIYDIEIRGAADDDARETSGEGHAPDERPSAFLSFPPADATFSQTVEFEDASPGALAAAARWFVAQGRAFDTEDHRAALAAFGLDLSDDGQTITNPPDTVDGAAKRVRSGRKPRLALLLLDTRCEALATSGSLTPSITAMEHARRGLAWLADYHPTLIPPAIEGVAREIGRWLSRKL